MKTSLLIKEIKKRLNYNRWSQKNLSLRLGVSPKYINDIIKGRKQKIPIKIAIGFGFVLGDDVEYWAKLNVISRLLQLKTQNKTV